MAFGEIIARYAERAIERRGRQVSEVMETAGLTEWPPTTVDGIAGVADALGLTVSEHADLYRCLTPV
jgi:hypothetical protein